MRAGEPYLGTKVTSLGPQVKSSQNGERQFATSSPTSDIFLVTINLSVTQDYRPGKSHLLDPFASHKFLSAVCDSDFQFLSTFFTFNLIPPQLVSFMVRLEQNSLCLVLERM